MNIDNGNSLSFEPVTCLGELYVLVSFGRYFQSITWRDAMDKIGISASLLCAAHCAAMPFAIALLPVLGIEFLADKRIEWALLGLMALVALVSTGMGTCRHKSFWPVCVLVCGVGLMAYSHANHSCCQEHISVEQISTAVLGGFAIAASHAINLKLCRKCVCCERWRE